jgi:hypothetical protein
MNPKQFILLAGDRDFPEPGINSLVDSFDTIEEAKAFYKKAPKIDNVTWNWYQIINRDTWDIVTEKYWAYEG